MKKLFLLVGLGTALLGQNVTLSLGSGSGIAGSAVAIPIALTSTGGAQAAGLQFSIGNSSGITGVTIMVANAASGAQKSASCLGGTCVVYGMNENIISNGPVATATFQLGGQASGSIPVQLTGAFAVDALGNPIPASATAGTVTVSSVPMQLTGVVCSPSTMTLNAAGSCTVSLNSAAASGAQISLSSSSSVITIPGSVAVAAGQSSATFPVTSGSVTGSQSAIVSATLNGSSQSTTVVVSAPVLTPVSVAPSGASGTAQTFTFTFSDSQSSANLSAAAFLIAPSLVYTNACLVVYDHTRGTIQLEWDNAAGANARAVTATTALQNSHCSIGATTVTSSGLVNTISIAVTFNSTFSGTKNIYAYGADSGGTVNTGWVQEGTYTVNAVNPLAVTAVSSTPNAGSGTGQTFSFVFSDSQSASNLSAAAILIGSSTAYSNACLLVYDATQHTIQLESDSAASASQKAITSASALQNSQCSVGAASVTTAGLTNTLTVAINFTGAFTGTKNIYLYGADTGGTVNTGWVQKGTYTVTSLQAPVITAASVTPNAGVGPNQTFSFTFSDSQSASNLSAAAFLIGPSLAYPNSCLMVYDRTRGTIQLESDNVASASVEPVGSATPMQNSQCTVTASSVTTAGMQNTISVTITFNPTFSGLKNIYVYGADTDGTINTGWVQMGTWTAD